MTLQRVTQTGLSRNGTVLLELRRRCVSQRLNELQITLGHIRRRPQHDGESEDGRRSPSQTDSSTTQQGEGGCYPGTAGCAAVDSWQQGSLPAGQSLGQQTAESNNLGNYELDCRIPVQERSDAVQSNNPGALLDGQMFQSKDGLLLNAPGTQELSSQMTLENTSGLINVHLRKPTDQTLDLNLDECS